MIVDDFFNVNPADFCRFIVIWYSWLALFLVPVIKKDGYKFYFSG